MKRIEVPLLELVATAALVVIAISACALFVPREKFGDMATWAGAVGTFLAFAGTIWVASAESRRRAHEDLIKARLHAAGMTLRLVHTRGVVAEAARLLTPPGLVVNRYDLMRIADALKSQISVFSTRVPEMRAR